MSTDTLPSCDQPSDAAAAPGAATGLWLCGSLLAAVVFGIGAGYVPARLRLFYLFPIVHGLLLANVLQVWRRQFTDAPASRRASLWLATLVVVSLLIGGWQAARNWQQTGGGKPQPGAALARQMVEQMPVDGERIDADARQKLLEELTATAGRRTVRGWLAARAGGLRSPWPEVLWVSECLVAVLAVILWNRHASCHAGGGRTGGPAS